MAIVVVNGTDSLDQWRAKQIQSQRLWVILLQ